MYTQYSPISAFPHWTIRMQRRLYQSNLLKNSLDSLINGFGINSKSLDNLLELLHKSKRFWIIMNLCAFLAFEFSGIPPCLTLNRASKKNLKPDLAYCHSISYPISLIFDLDTISFSYSIYRMKRIRAIFLSNFLTA